MMRRIIKYKVIEECAGDLQNQISSLIEIKKKLIMDVHRIDNYYRGLDSNIIIGKYLDKIKELDNYINNINICIDYLLKISSNYSISYNKINEFINEKINGQGGFINMGTLNINPKY